MLDASRGVGAPPNTGRAQGGQAPARNHPAPTTPPAQPAPAAPQDLRQSGGTSGRANANMSFVDDCTPAPHLMADPADANRIVTYDGRPYLGRDLHVLPLGGFGPAAVYDRKRQMSVDLQSLEAAAGICPNGDVKSGLNPGDQSEPYLDPQDQNRIVDALGRPWLGRDLFYDMVTDTVTDGAGQVVDQRTLR